MGTDNRISRRIAVETWLRHGLEDFIIQYGPLNDWIWYQPFFVHQGLEKVCKAYLIGRHAGRFRRAGRTKARKIIDGLARSFGHKLGRLVTRVCETAPGISRIVEQRYDGYTGQQVLMVLEAAYLECRYPVAESISRQFPIPNTKPRIHWDPLASSSLEKCAFAISHGVIQEIERSFRVKLSEGNPFQGRINDHTWERFSRQFFGREVLCEKCGSERKLQGASAVLDSSRIGARHGGSWHQGNRNSTANNPA